MPQEQFKGYSEDQMKRIASKLGHTGDLDTFNSYLQSNESALGKYNTLQDSVTQRYAQGGVAKINEGIKFNANTTVGDVTLAQSLTPRLATGAVTEAATTDVGTNQLMSTKTGQVSATDPKAAVTKAATKAAVGPKTQSANVAATATAAPKVAQTLNKVKAESGTVAAPAKIKEAQQTTSAVSNLDASQGTAIQVAGAPVRNLEGGELVNPVADSQKAAQFTEEIKAAQADPSAKSTVQGQLATLMTSFDDGKTPAWAAGAMRNVTAQMASRGIGSSSMAGQALIQAALESSLPIATADAQTFASFEMTNLNNKQQRSMLAAQQRAEFMGQEFDQGFQARVMNATKISEIAKTNFSAEQQVALENAQLSNTVNLTNLSNKQAKVMAEASSLSQLDMANLSNRQQAQVQNAQSFLDMDMANLSNAQQTAMFKAQSSITSLLSDSAAENASKQFNATSQNQTDQFFANMSSGVSQFNASQSNAQAQFNSGEGNAQSKFNAEIRNQRDQFNAQNSLVINQSNAQWRRSIATADTASINRVNEINAKAVLDVSNTAYNNLWQEHRDDMDWAYKQSEGSRDRYERLTIAKLASETDLAAAKIATDGAASTAAGSAIGTLLTSNLGGTVLGKLFGG